MQNRYVNIQRKWHKQTALSTGYESRYPRFLLSDDISSVRKLSAGSIGYGRTQGHLKTSETAGKKYQYEAGIKHGTCWYGRKEFCLVERIGIQGYLYSYARHTGTSCRVLAMTAFPCVFSVACSTATGRIAGHKKCSFSWVV